MRDVGGKIRLPGKDIFNFPNHMVEGDHQLFQLNGHAGRLQSRIQIFGGDIFNGGADVTQGQVSLTHRDTNHQHNQQADRRGNGKKILLQRLKVVEMKINREPDQHDVVLDFALQRCPA